MKIGYDNKKNTKNIAERNLSFDRVIDFDFETAVFLVDDRTDYNEQRILACGYLDGRLHILCFTERNDEICVISFRKANKKEAKRYGKALTTD